jgi:CheY-like chemotaxis protein/glycosyltransferase involved in cell wall biosynthesis
MWFNKQFYESETFTERKILIVDDDPDVCQILNIYFRSHGYQTASMASGTEAIDWIENKDTDVILLDVMMPGMDGWETFRHLRARTSAPVVFLTALNSGEVAAQALTIGAKDFVRKPFHPAELLARIQALLDIEQTSPLSPGRRFRYHGVSVRPTVSLIIPTLNEAKNLPYILPNIPMDVIDEVILVDGRSTDGTVEVSRQIMPSIKLVMENKPGKGAALAAGYKASSGDIIIVMDADGSNDPREIPRFIHALREGADFVKGSRFASGGGTTDMPRIRRLGNAGFVHLVNLLFNATFTDLCYGYHAFWRYCLDTIDLKDVNGFEVDTALYLQALRTSLKIIEVPSFEGYRFFGVGKLRTIPDGLRVLRTIFNEFFVSLRSPHRDLPVGFGAQPAGYRETYRMIDDNAELLDIKSPQYSDRPK